ncbi:Aldo/keto reductase [Xylariaceae sp. FL0016]|nr:Aldo/keto reductase [Xylariaceae sp. FL0016]
MASNHPKLIFGAANIGTSYATPQAVSDLLDTLQSVGIDRIDTAARYPPTDPGASERLLGEAGVSERGFAIDTKILPGSHRPEAVAKSVGGSYERLQLLEHQLNVLYLHAPDLTTPLEEQAAALDAQYKKGLFTELGICNFSAPMLKDLIEICDKRGFVKPTVYQGQYNLVYRNLEKTIMPTLRQHDIAFNAFSPLAGGFLTGRVSAGQAEGSRFEEGSAFGSNYRDWYLNENMHKAIETLSGILEAESISKAEAALRWIAYHSELGPTDAIILGASRPSQVEETAKAIRQGHLPHDVVGAMNNLWYSFSSEAK